MVLDRDLRVGLISARDPRAACLLDELTAELALLGYNEDEDLGYSVEEIESNGVTLFAASIEGEPVGIGGLELQHDQTAEIKRLYVRPEHRGSGIAVAIVDSLVTRARENGRTGLRLETGDRQHAAIAFYKRNGFRSIPRFGPYAENEASVCMQRDLVLAT